jgi:D-arabinonate dehydratase
MSLISKVECIEVNVPLPKPLAVGATVITHRGYAIIKVTTKSGVEGVAYCYTRSMPMAKILNATFGPEIIGMDTNIPERIRQNLLAKFWHSAEHGTFTAALSALDLAIWDALGKENSISLSRMLGQQHEKVLLCTVIGYQYDDNEAGLIAEVESSLIAGFKSFKMVIGAGTPKRDAERVRIVRELIGPEARLAVDAFRSFKDLDDARRRVDAIREYDISFVEDPFNESLGSLAADLRARTGALIAFGESQSGHRPIGTLVSQNYVDVVRIDALIVGGVREFMSSAAIASARGLPVATHIHSEIHIHFGAAINNLYSGGLEYMNPSNNVDAIHKLMSNPLVVDKGYALVPTGPGLGIEWNWKEVEKYA